MFVVTVRPLLQCSDEDSSSFFAVCKKRKAVFARLFYAAATLEISWHVHGKKLDYAVEKFVACFRRGKLLFIASYAACAMSYAASIH